MLKEFKEYSENFLGQLNFKECNYENLNHEEKSTSKAISVTELSGIIKFVLETDEVLQNVFVLGEVSNFKKNIPSGHLYFSIKDKESIIKCIMFSQNAKKNIMEMKDGIRIYVYGHVSCYPKSGQYQLYVCKILHAGAGQINETLKKLDNKLQSEGLFDLSRKKEINKFPKSVGVITSFGGAVIHDIKSVLLRRNPLVKIFVYSVNVQGQSSSQQIVEGINYFNNVQEIDTILIARGGGSIEELWSFNDEEVVRTVANSKKSTISAIGHDTDFTLCDKAADLRSPTPSVAAELSSVDIFEILNHIEERFTESRYFIKNKISIYNKEIDIFKSDLKRLNIINKVNKIKLNLNELELKFNNNIDSALNFKKNELEKLENKLSFLNPQNILERGFCLALIDSKIIKDPNEIKENSNIKLIFNDKILNLTVKNIDVLERNFIC